MVEVADIFSPVVGVELIQNGFRVCVQSAAPFPVAATASALARAICHECDHLDGKLYVDLVEGELHDTVMDEEE